MTSWIRPQRPSRFPKAKSDPIIFTSGNTKQKEAVQHLLYRAEDDQIIELYSILVEDDSNGDGIEEQQKQESNNYNSPEPLSDWNMRNLCQLTITAPPLSHASELKLTCWKGKGSRNNYQVIYRCKENRIHMLSLQTAPNSLVPTWKHEDLMGTSSAAAPTALLTSSLKETGNEEEKPERSETETANESITTPTATTPQRTRHIYEITPSIPTPPPPPPFTWTPSTPSSLSVKPHCMEGDSLMHLQFSDDLPTPRVNRSGEGLEDKLFMKWISTKKFDEAIVTGGAKRKVTKNSMLSSSLPATLSDISLNDAAAENLHVEVSSKSLMILKELVQTEESYVKQLQIMIDVFLLPMRNQQVVTPNQIQAIFSNLEDLTSSHLCFLNVLKSAINDITQFVTIFIEQTGFMKDYITYVNGFDNATLIIRKLCNEVPAFANFIKKCEENPRCGLSDIGSFMILPIQRVPRYLLLLRDLLKEISKESLVYDLVCQALKKIKDLADLINEEKRIAEGRALGSNVLRRIKGKIPITMDIGEQQLIREGEMIWFTKGSNGEKVSIYLFQALLILCQVEVPATGKNNKSSNNINQNELPLRLKALENFYDSSSAIQVTEFFDIEGVSTFKITITPKKGSKREYILGSATDKQEWLFILTQVLRTAASKLDIDKSKLQGVLANRLTSRPSLQDLKEKNIVAEGGGDPPQNNKPQLQQSKSPLQSLFHSKKG